MFSIRIADVVVEIDNIHSYIYDYCKDWLCNDTPDLRIKVSASELRDYIDNCGYKVAPEQAERILMCKKLAERMIIYKGFLVHGAVVEYGGCGIIFSGKRGIGKTTHLKLWMEAFGESVRVVNGDKPIVFNRGGRFVAHGTPWRGKENMGDGSCVEVKKLCFIKQGASPSVRKISPREAWTRLCRQTVYPDDRRLYDEFATQIAEFLKSVDVYVITVSESAESAIAVRNGIMN